MRDEEPVLYSELKRFERITDEKLAKTERAAAAYSLRMQAQAHEALGDLHTRIARGMEAEADAIEVGSRSIERRPDGIREAPEDAEESARRAPVLSRVKRGESEPFVQEDGSILGPKMQAWIDQFDSRWTQSEHFCPVVNRLADDGCHINFESATLATRHVAEREELAAREAGGTPDGE